ncbi:hypothetical protein MHY87_17725 [Microvirga sp. ACRRW]|uniref:hypothetical protein n=1 Tax=Microvirga sp. ACRRW TaxID=2918205 RepID=UPI001EF6C0CD|nr:hypothetical protein [Microvirga sp. ACRRW]MCG7394744.1 hypothetical protein [Microvirga sp. ACRRW]
MQRILLASLLFVGVSACGYHPDPEDLIHIVDSPADVRVCQNLGEVSPVVPTTPGFGSATDSMKEAVVALGGTHLYLQQTTQDWSLVRGIAYRCGPGEARETVIRAKG